LNDRDILGSAGKISHAVAEQLAQKEYEKFNRTRIAQSDQNLSDFDQTVKMLEAEKKKQPPS
jgi:hypothetical protein